MSRSLYTYLDDALNLFLEFSKSRKPALLVSHYDADGISSASIIMNVLYKLEIPFHVKIVNQLDDIIFNSLKGYFKNYDLLIFTDLGSGQKDLLNEYSQYLKEKCIVVLDHHQPTDEEVTTKNFIEVNPRLFHIDGTREACASTIAYLLARRLNSNNVHLSTIAIVGALGDMQDCGEKGRLIGLNREIVKEGEQAGYVKEELGLRLFGLRSRPLVECISRTMNPFIPGLTGNELATYKFLKSIGVEPEINGELRTFPSLSKEEVRKLVTGLIKYMIEAGMSSKEAEKIVGYTYLLPEEKPDTPLYDAREFAALINACSRLEKHSIAIAVCLGDRKDGLQEALRLNNIYRGKLSEYLKLVATRRILEEYDELYCVHGDIIGIEEKIIGTVASIAASGLLSKAKPIIALTRAKEEGFLKISARMPRSLPTNNINLGEILKRVAQRVGGRGGGHEVAAGALIPIEKKQEFLSLLREELVKI